MKLKTKLLQDVLGTLTNMIKYVNIKPITNLVEIYADNNGCHIGATDNITKIIGTIYNVEEPIDNFVVNLQDLYKLVKLTTKEEIEIKKEKDHIILKGNGKYKIPIQFDEVGNEIKLPLPLVKFTDEVQLFQLENIKKVQKLQEFALCKDTNHSELCKYGTIDNKTIATDSFVMSVSNYSLPLNEMNNNVVAQLCKLPFEVISYCVSNSILRFDTKNDNIIYDGQIYMEQTKEFPSSMIAPILGADMYNTIIDINTKELEDIIKRLNIFQGAFNVPCVYFEDNKIYNKDKTIEEIISGEVKQKGDVNVVIKIEQLLNVLRRMDAQITLYLGKTAIKVQDTEKYYIISAMDNKER